MTMDDDAGDIRQGCRACVDVIEGQQRRGGDTQRSRRGADSKSVPFMCSDGAAAMWLDDIGRARKRGTVRADPARWSAASSSI